jgi:predicted CopG family antitoxin
MYTYMTKVISISDEAYEELSRMKNGSSFTEVILELSKEKKKKSIMDLAGAWKNIDTDKIKEEIYKERKIGSRRFK